MAVANVKAPLEMMVRLSTPLSCNTRPVPERPDTVPPMVYVVGAVVEPQEARANENAIVKIVKYHFIFTLPPPH
jgi:hypothetical protein